VRVQDVVDRVDGFRHQPRRAAASSLNVGR
jgi:hypothetical protein